MRIVLICQNCLRRLEEPIRVKAEREGENPSCEECQSTDFFVLPRKRQKRLKNTLPPLI